MQGLLWNRTQHGWVSCHVHVGGSTALKREHSVFQKLFNSHAEVSLS